MDREFVGRGSWVVDRRADGVIWCWVAGSGFGDGVAVLCGVGLRVAVADGVVWCWVVGAGFSDEETGMRDKDER